MIGTRGSVRTHKQYRAVLKIVSKYELRSSYEKELRKLHSKRKAPKLMTRKNLKIQDVRKALLVDQSYRSRLVAMKTELTRDTNYLEELRKDLKNILIYSECVTPFTSKTDRVGYIGTQVDDIFDKLEEAYSILEQVDIIIEDIDKTTWSLKLVMQSFDLSTRPELNL